MAHNMVYYIEYCNFQFAVIHCLSIIHLKYFIGYISESVLKLIYQIISITYCDFLLAMTTLFLVTRGLFLITSHIIKFRLTITLKKLIDGA